VADPLQLLVGAVADAVAARLSQAPRPDDPTWGKVSQDTLPPWIHPKAYVEACRAGRIAGARRWRRQWIAERAAVEAWQSIRQCAAPGDVADRWVAAADDLRAWSAGEREACWTEAVQRVMALLGASLSLRHGAAPPDPGGRRPRASPGTAPQPQATTPGAHARNDWKQGRERKATGGGRKSTAGACMSDSSDLYMGSQQRTGRAADRKPRPP